ncbi:MAG TPA: class I SAM-dependent methyltransferase [Gemmataceae bacterium]|nr:class I SAM-dependent methyltransferase [Gemmataceae bacterium]
MTDPWQDPAVALQAIFGSPENDAQEEKMQPLQGPHNPHEFARKLYTLESLQPVAWRQRTAELPEPYSLQWFLDIENQRHSKHGKWIPKLLEFAKHRGERLLGVGHGLGTDWAQYAQNGAEVIVCSPADAQLDLVRRNFRLRNLDGRFVKADPKCLPLEPSSIDVVCISSLHHGIDEPEKVVDEVYRVLKPGGKVLAVTPAYYDVDYWVRTLFFWNRWFKPYRGKNPLRCKRRLTGGQLSELFTRFIDLRIRKRQLRRPEVPHVWRWIPLPILARLMGRVLVLKAFKPLIAALPAEAVELRRAA